MRSLNIAPFDRAPYINLSNTRYEMTAKLNLRLIASAAIALTFVGLSIAQQNLIEQGEVPGGALTNYIFYHDTLYIVAFDLTLEGNVTVEAGTTIRLSLNGIEHKLTIQNVGAGQDVEVGSPGGADVEFENIEQVEFNVPSRPILIYNTNFKNPIGGPDNPTHLVELLSCGNVVIDGCELYHDSNNDDFYSLRIDGGGNVIGGQGIKVRNCVIDSDDHGIYFANGDQNTRLLIDKCDID